MATDATHGKAKQQKARATVGLNAREKLESSETTQFSPWPRVNFNAFANLMFCSFFLTQISLSLLSMLPVPCRHRRNAARPDEISNFTVSRVVVECIVRNCCRAWNVPFAYDRKMQLLWVLAHARRRRR